MKLQQRKIKWQDKIKLSCCFFVPYSILKKCYKISMNVHTIFNQTEIRWREYA